MLLAAADMKKVDFENKAVDRSANDTNTGGHTVAVSQSAQKRRNELVMSPLLTMMLKRTRASRSSSRQPVY